MPLFQSSIDGAQLHYVDYRPAPSPPAFKNSEDKSRDNSNTTLVFIHGWPMSSQMYEHLMLRLCENERIRCIASDRRGFGKSEWSGPSSRDITYDTFAQDTAQLVGLLKLNNFVLIGSSMGCGEILLAYFLLAADVQAKCKGFIWLGPSLPFPLQTDSIPDAPSRELWNSLLTGFRADRVGFVKNSIGSVFGTSFNIGIEVPVTVLAKFENIISQADALAIERCVQIITHRDFTSDLKKIDGKIPILVLHGDSDQGMPASASAELIPNYAKQTKVKIYSRAAHGLYLTHAEDVIKDILGFLAENA